MLWVACNASTSATELATLAYAGVRVASLTSSDTIGQSVQYLAVFVAFTSGRFELLAIEDPDFPARVADQFEFPEMTGAHANGGPC
jgi:hypothetical protein